MPADWKEFSIKRTFRGKVYKINVYRQTQSGNSQYMIVNGKRYESNIVPIITKSEVKVEVYI